MIWLRITGKLDFENVWSNGRMLQLTPVLRKSSDKVLKEMVSRSAKASGFKPFKNKRRRRCGSERAVTWMRRTLTNRLIVGNIASVDLQGTREFD
jgi:hypothetical protein